MTQEAQKAKELYAIGRGCLDGWLNYDEKHIPAKSIAQEIAFYVEMNQANEEKRKWWYRVKQEIKSL